MKTSTTFFLLLFTISVFAQDDFWSSSGNPSNGAISGTARSFYSGIEGLSTRRDPESIDVEQPADLKKEKTNWEKLVEAGEKEISNYIEKEIKNQVKKAVTKEFGKAVGQQAGKAAGAILNKIAEDKAKQEAAEAERQRLAAIERRKNRQISIMGELQQQVIASFVDNAYGLQASQTENFFFFINLEEDEGISFSLFNVFTNSYNQLPYKVELVKEYKQKSGKEQAWLYGPFPSLSKAKSQIKDVAETAYLGFYEIREDVEYKSASVSSGVASPTSGDFWGNTDKKKLEKKEETTTDFWGVKKKKKNEN